MSDAVFVCGVGMTAFGKHRDRDAASLGAEAALAAIKDSGLTTKDVEAAYCGHVLEGMAVGQRALAQIGVAGIPITNVENVCASGAAALREGALAIRAGEHDVVLVLGVEHLTSKFEGALAPDKSDVETAVGLTMPGIYAMRARRYLDDFGLTREQLALVSVKNRQHASRNPLAYLRDLVTVEEVVGSRLIADPLRKLDCCPATDGAAAAILVSQRMMPRISAEAIRLAASVLRTGAIESEPASMSFESLTNHTAREAFERAGVGPADVNVAEVHDCFSIAEATRVEGCELFPRGEYLHAVERGEATIGGRLPVNPSGGLLGKGHPLGATGVAQVVELVRQLRGEAGDRQVAGARVGLAHCRGGKAAGTESAACTVQVLVR